MMATLERLTGLAESDSRVSAVREDTEGMVSWIGFNRTYVPFHAPRRVAGESKYT